MNITNPNYTITIAGPEHAEAIRRIYRLAQINPAQLLELAELAVDPATAAEFKKGLGGFISPHDERDMELTLEKGLVVIGIEGEEVVAYNRYITEAESVHYELCAALNIDPALRDFSRRSFTNWSGLKQKKPGKTLKQVHWTDRQQALLAFSAALAGLENAQSGKLVWGVDAAVLPEHRKRGISRATLDRVSSESGPEFGYRCFRIFEICEINGRDIRIENADSKNAFINTNSKHFAYIEEEIVINTAITLLVRWNFWLKSV